MHLTRPTPIVTFDKDYTLCVGRQTLEFSYKGANHEPRNISIYAPKQKIIMLVDLVVPGWVPFACLAISKNIPGWIAAHDQVLAYAFDHYVGGHAGHSGNRTDVEIQRAYGHDLFNNCNETLALTNTIDPVLGAAALLGSVTVLNPGNRRAQSKVFMDASAEYCANKTNERWLGRRGGADVFGFANYA